MLLPTVIGGIAFILGRKSNNSWIRALANVGGVIAIVSTLLVLALYGSMLLNRLGLK